MMLRFEHHIQAVMKRHRQVWILNSSSKSEEASLSSPFVPRVIDAASETHGMIPQDHSLFPIQLLFEVWPYMTVSRS